MKPITTFRTLLSIGLLANTLAVQAVTCADATIPPTNPDNAYTDHGDGTVTDVRTGLMWQRCSVGQTWDDSTCTGSAGGYTWYAAMAQAGSSRVGAYDDWRLPNVKELLSLTERCRSRPSINDAVFPATSSSNFWSGSPAANNSSSAWHVAFDYGFAFYGPGRYDVYYGVRLVRGGQSFATFAGNASVPPPAVSFNQAAETLPDGTYQVGAAVKRWGFVNGAQPITGLKAVQVTAAAGLNVGASEVALGDVAPGAAFVVEVPVSLQRTGAAMLSSEWKLVDGVGRAVTISNSVNGQFWMKLRTNRAPRFDAGRPLQVAGPVGTTVIMDLIAVDADGDSLTFSTPPQAGVTLTGNRLSLNFTDGLALHEIPVTVSDGIESVTEKARVLTFDASSVARFYDDVTVDTTPYADAILYATLRGLLVGSDAYAAGVDDACNAGFATNPAGIVSRVFKPSCQPSWPELLAMLVQAAAVRGDLTVPQPASWLTPPGMAPWWVRPYYTAARLRGAIDATTDLTAQPRNADVARVLAALLGLPKRLDGTAASSLMPALSTTVCAQAGQTDCFDSEMDRDAMRLAILYGLLPASKGADPQGSATRAEIADLMTRVIRAPSARTVLSALQINVAAPLRLSLADLRADVIRRDGVFILDPALQPAPGGHLSVDQIYLNGLALLITPVLAADFSGIDVPTESLAAGTHRLVVALRNLDGDTRDYRTVSFFVKMVDRDGDGVPDHLDLWPDNPGFAKDANGNGIPDEVDVMFGLSNRLGSEQMIVDGTAMTLTDLVLAGNFAALIPADQVTLSGAPLIGSASPGDASAVVSFSAPGNDGGSAISLYTATSSPAGKTASCTAPCNSVVVTGLQNGTAYTFTVFATNAVGNSSASAASNAVTPQAAVGETAHLPKGWNLVGNGSEQIIDPALAYGNASEFITVWKWLAAPLSQWAFYAPSLPGGGADYALGKGYVPLTAINPGEGYWLNISPDAGVSLAVKRAAAVPTSLHQALGGGWHLLAIGEPRSPGAFSSDIHVVDPTAPALTNGQVYTDLITLWAWDASLSQWYFWAPALVNAGGSALQDYIGSKGYLDFGATGKMLQDGAGFWINKR